MKCAHCGTENQLTQRFCQWCLRDLPGSQGTLKEEPETAAPTAPAEHIEDIPGALVSAEGFRRVNWELVYQSIETSHPKERQEQVLENMVLQWLNILQDELGGNYAVYRSDRFFILCDVGAESARQFAGFGEKVEKAILESLGEVAWGSWPGMKVVLVFSEDDDYYQYLSFYYAEGTHAGSIGIHIKKGYPHIAIRLADVIMALRTLAHELVHSCLHHLPLPIWLNEGVTMTLEKAAEGWLPATGKDWANQYWADISGWRPPIIWHEIAEQHHAFWNEDRLQGFWAGTTFDEPGEPAELSYHLAEVLVAMLAKDRDKFLVFLSQAHFDDAGLAAAQECLGVELGEVAGFFLGEGTWRPQSAAIKALWMAENSNPDTSENASQGF